MRKRFTAALPRRSRRLAYFAAIVALASVTPCYAEDMEMPNAAEVQYYSPEAQQFYAAGIAALDRADYANAYNMLAKASALQPAAIRLNHITATLSIYHGRQNNADRARDYYQTAISCYENILRVPTITADLRRQVINELKAAQQEGADLAQRDAVREANGTTFLLEYNRKYANQEPRKAGAAPEATPATTITQELVNTITQMMIQQQNANGYGGLGMPGVEGMSGLSPAEQGIPAAGPMPGPGTGMPGEPGMPGAQPGMPGAEPNPMQPPPGVQQGQPGMGLPEGQPTNNGGQPGPPQP